MAKFLGDQGYQAFRILQLAFVVAPIWAGLDKFFNLLTPLGHSTRPIEEFVSLLKAHEIQLFIDHLTFKKASKN